MFVITSKETLSVANDQSRVGGSELTDILNTFFSSKLELLLKHEVKLIIRNIEQKMEGINLNKIEKKHLKFISESDFFASTNHTDHPLPWPAIFSFAIGCLFL